MIRGIITQSIRLRYLVIILALVLTFFGIYQLSEMPVDIYPEFNPPIVEVQTEALGLSSTDVESMLTVPMEADLLNGVAWLDHIYSDSVAGMSSILMIFEPGTDPIRARQMVQERLTQSFALPNVSAPPTMLQPLSTTSRAMMVSLSSEDLSLIDMGVLARWVIAPRLMGVDGVANVAIWGLREWQLQVLVDPQELQNKGVTLNQIIDTAGEALWVSPLSYLESSSPGTAGWIDTPNQRLSIRHELPITSAEDLAKLPVKGTAYSLADVSEVVEDHQPLIGDAVLNNGNPGLLLVIEKFPNANLVDVTNGVDTALEAMKPGLTGVDIDTTVFRPANYIALASGNLTTVLLIGAGLLILALFLLYWDWRPTLISLVVIPISIIIALLVLYLFGSTLNVLLVAGLVVTITLIVDDAIIDPENIRRRLAVREGEMDSETKMSLIVEAASEMRGPIVFAFLVLLLVLLPVFLLQGLAGTFFQPFTLAYSLAMLVSIVVALTLTPALSMVLLRNHERQQSPIVKWLGGVYNAILSRTAKAPAVVYIGAAVIVVLSLIAVPFMNLSLMPTFKQTDLRIQWDAAAGTSRPEMNRIMTKVTQELQTIPGVVNVGAHAGRAITGDQITDINSGEIWVRLDPAGYDTTLAAVEDVVSGYPGLLRGVETYQPSRIGEVFTASQSNNIDVRIYGHEFEVLKDKADEVQAALSNIAGLKNVQVKGLEMEPQVEIEVDLAAAERYQIKPGDVRRATTTLLSGLRVGNLYEEQKVFDVVVWAEPDLRKNLTDLQNLLIDTPGGGHVRLGDVADIRVAPIPVNIKRDSVSRYIDVTGTVGGRSYGDVAADIQSRLNSVDFPLEYHAELQGNYAQQRTAQLQSWLLAAIVAVGVILLLQACFWSWQLALGVFVTVLTSLSGGVLAAFLAGGEISLGSLLGFLAVAGLAVRYGIVFTRHLQYLEHQEGETFGLDLVLRGSAERLQPILITAFSLGFFVLPLVVAGGMPGLEILHPMAVVLLGGLVTTTLFTLFIIPAFYLRYGMKTEIAEMVRSEYAATD